MKVIVMRGIPGAGKSTWAGENYPEAIICSADSYFMTYDGYKFDRNKLSEAHKSCMYNFLMIVQNKNLQDCTVIVDNTNVKTWEFMGYIQVAQALGHEVEVVYLETPPEEAHKRNVHGVPEETVFRMYQQFDRTPKHLKETVIEYLEE